MAEFEISEKILKETTKCEKDFPCLSSGGKGLCKVEDSIGGEVCFIESKDNSNWGDCSYQASFGYSYMCTCPTRKEIYNKYEI